MAEYFALQAALCFATSHILIRRGLVDSNALTGAFVSLGMTALILWFLLPFFVSLSSFWTPAVGYFLAAGIFAPGLGRTLTYVGIEKVGVARSVPISNSSPLFASLIAVFLLDEIWKLQNFLGTIFVLAGIVVLSRSHAEHTQWRGFDLIFPVLAALAFAISSNLRKLGLLESNTPLMAAALTAATAFVFAVGLLKLRGGWQALMLSRNSWKWFFAAGIANTTATLSVFYALSFGDVVVVEPLTASNPVLSLILSALFLRDLEKITGKVVLGALCTVAGTILVITR
jgi:DME family drug/metabolite transporter